MAFRRESVEDISEQVSIIFDEFLIDNKTTFNFPIVFDIEGLQKQLLKRHEIEASAEEIVQALLSGIIDDNIHSLLDLKVDIRLKTRTYDAKSGEITFQLNVSLRDVE